MPPSSPFPPKNIGPKSAEAIAAKAALLEHEAVQPEKPMLRASVRRAGPMPTGKSLESILATGPAIPSALPHEIATFWREIGPREAHHPDLVVLVDRHAHDMTAATPAGSSPRGRHFYGELRELTDHLLSTTKLPDGRPLYDIADYNSGTDNSVRCLLNLPYYAFSALEQFNKKQAIWVAWDAKRSVLDREWSRVWAIECAPAVAAAKEAAERRRVAAEEAAILAEAKRRLAEETKEQRILAMMAELRAK